tara:strand:- start:1545 stop:3431 length:1887 start_codon:yes stop_codon:yes gene_type:complete
MKEELKNPSKKIISDLVNLYNSKNYNELKRELDYKLKEYPKSDLLWNISGILEIVNGNLKIAEENFRKVILLNPNDPSGYINLGNIYNDNGNIDESIKCFKTALEKNPKNFLTHYNLANALTKKKEYILAINLYLKSIELNPKYFNAYNNLANIYLVNKNFKNAIKFYEKAYELYKNDSVLSALIYSKINILDWSSISEFKKIENVIGIEKDPIPPFQTLSLQDNPKNQFLRSENWSKKYQKEKKNLNKNLKISNNEKIRVGYFSSDFYDHPVMFLISGLLREHDKNKFEIYIFNYGFEKKTKLVNETMKHVHLYEDISKKSDTEILKLVKNYKLDIAIDLKGYTGNSRSELFSYRLAPIQINFLGFPSTLGSNHFDYLIADKILIPSNLRKYYAEKIIYLPNCYQPNDNKRVISKKKTSRKDFDLSDDHFIFCCFNTPYKILPKEFNIWIRVLKKIKKSVLWLMDTDLLAKQNLINYAKNKGIDKSKFIFAKYLPHEEHLERIRHADLFLDTFNYNAHTTCSDSLWAGVPIVTKKGRQFAARVSSSLLKALGMSELITNTESDYEKLILELSRNRNKLKRIRDKISSNLYSKALFDTEKYTKNFEKALNQIYLNKKIKDEIKDIEID